MLKIQSVWNVSDGESSSRLCKYLKLLAILIKKCCKSSNTNCNVYIKLNPAMTAPRWWYPKINLFTNKWTKIALRETNMFFCCFFHFNNFFVTPGHIPVIFIFETQFYQNCHIAKLPSIPEHIFKIWKPIRKLIL